MILTGHGRYTIGLKLTLGNWLLWIALVFSSNEFNGIETSEPVTPLNVVGVYGERVQLNCSVGSDATRLGHWQKLNLTDNPKDEPYIFMGDRIWADYVDLFEIDKPEKGFTNLVIKELSTITSGRYTCIHIDDVTSASTRYRVQVIAMDAKPACSVEHRSGSVMGNCSIGFSGFWSPELEWRNAKGMMIENATETTIDSTVTSSVILPFDKADPPETYNLTCTPKFTLKNRPTAQTGTMAENIPEFPHSCTAFDQKLKPPDADSSKKPSGATPSDIEAVHETNPTSPPSVSVSVHGGHSPYLCWCLVIFVIIGIFIRGAGKYQTE